MAAAYIKVLCCGNVVRTFGGNKKEVRTMKAEYEAMSVDEFVQKHPAYAGKCKRKKDIVVVLKKK